MQIPAKSALANTEPLAPYVKNNTCTSINEVDKFLATGVRNKSLTRVFVSNRHALTCHDLWPIPMDEM